MPRKGGDLLKLRQVTGDGEDVVRCLLDDLMKGFGPLLAEEADGLLGQVIDKVIPGLGVLFTWHLYSPRDASLTGFRGHININAERV